MEFDVKIIPYTGDDSWIPKTIDIIKKCLVDDRIPSPAKDCDYCAYREAVSESLPKSETKIKKEIETKNTLFG